MSDILPISSKPRPHGERRQCKFKRETTDAAGVRDIVEIQLYVLDDESNDMEIFQVRREFSKAIITMGWNTGPKRFAAFEHIVRGSASASRVWDTLCDSVAAQTVATFGTAYISFFDRQLRHLKYDSQLDYLRNTKKSTSYTVQQWLDHLEASNALATLFPDASGRNGLPANELKRIFYCSMPKSWQEAHKCAGRRYNTDSLQQIFEYMELQEQMNPPSNRNNGSGNNYNSNSSASSTNGNSNGNGNRNRRNRRGKRNGNQKWKF